MIHHRRGQAGAIETRVLREAWWFAIRPDSRLRSPSSSLPSDAWRRRSVLQGSVAAADTKEFRMRANLSMPATAIIPVLDYPDVLAAVTWLEQAFGFEVRLRIGTHRAQLQFEGGAIVVSESNSPDAAPGTGHSVMVRVEAIEAHLSRARQHGARIIRDLEEFPYGERQYSCLDPAGHSWTFSETIRNVDPAQWGGELAPRLPI
jgi:uncharacterized glyoxalase superfamily protein PhnB